MKLTQCEKGLRSVTALILAAVMALGMSPVPAAAAGKTYTVNVSAANVRASASTDGKVLVMASRGSTVDVIGTKGDWYKVTYKGETGYIRKDMLVEGDVATSNSSTPTAKVTGNSVNIRKSASTSATSLKRVDKGTVMTAISVSDGWVKVKYSGVTGYVKADFVKVSGLKASDGSSDSLTEMDKTGTINASEVNVRKSASTSGAKLYSLKSGASVSVTGLKGNWYRVHTSSGTGYVLAKYVSLSSDSASSNSVAGSDSTDATLKDMSASGTISGSCVNVRKSASTSASALFRLASGSKVSVTGKQGDWYKIKCSDGTGFVLGSFIKIASTSSSSVDVTDVSAMGTTNASSVNVRETPSKSADSLYKLDKGADVKITGKTANWYRVSTSKGEGFVLKDFITVQSSSSNSSSESTGNDVTSIQKRLIELGYLSGSADGNFGADTKSAVQAFQKNAGLTADGVVGATTLKALNSSSAPSAGASSSGSSSGAALKEGATGAAVKKLQQRLIDLNFLSGSADGNFGSATTDAVKAFQKQTGMTADGIAGSATQDAIYASDAPSKKTAADDVETQLDTLKSTLSMGDSGAQVKKVQQRLIALKYMSGSADGNFGAKTRTAVMVFQKQTGLTVDGKVGPTTYKKLLSDSADKYDGKTTVSSNSSSGESSDSGSSSSGSSGSSSSGSSSSGSSSSGSSDSSQKSGVRMADWWTSDIQSIFSRGTEATITDVLTGISWHERRRGGTNHADCEPLTAEDTAKLKQAYGGSWSWNRRAIWVTVGGHTYAASMNGMPHGIYAITDNNFSGHHCIHFLNSRTHTGNRLDSAHQAAVRYAYQAGN